LGSSYETVTTWATLPSTAHGIDLLYTTPVLGGETCCRYLFGHGATDCWGSSSGKASRCVHGGSNCSYKKLDDVTFSIYSGAAPNPTPASRADEDRKAIQKAHDEEGRKAIQKANEEMRAQVERRADAEVVAAQKAKEARRAEEERKAIQKAHEEEARRAEEERKAITKAEQEELARRAEEERKAIIQKAHEDEARRPEKERKASQRAEEERRAEDERRAEEEVIAAQKATEARRAVEQRRAVQEAHERKEARRTEEERKAEVRQAVDERKAVQEVHERNEARRAEEERQAEARRSEEERERKDSQKAQEAKRAEEERKTRQKSEEARQAEQMKEAVQKAHDEEARRAQEQRQAEEQRKAVQSTGAIQATGDPHLQNVYGQRFDLMRPGNHMLILIPRGERAENTLLRVDADARQMGLRCTPEMYFQELNITGAWAEAKRAGGLRFRAGDKQSGSPSWEQFGEIELKIAHGHTQKGTQYLNLYVKHLKRAGFAVGGLLGLDDHTEAAMPLKECLRARVALLQAAADQNDDDFSTAEASL